jgi:hypothetical protein
MVGNQLESEAGSITWYLALHVLDLASGGFVPVPFGSDPIRRVVLVGSVGVVVVPTCRLPNRTSAINSSSINRHHERYWRASASNLPAGDGGGADRQVAVFVERCRAEGTRDVPMTPPVASVTPASGRQPRPTSVVDNNDER